MSSSCLRRDDCRLCQSKSLTRVLSLEPTPPANAFVEEHALGQAQEKFPLDVFFCDDCAHVQLSDVVDPKKLFENYVYVSGTSPVFVEHFEKYAEAMQSRFNLAEGDRVLDIGSNDGTLLKAFQKRGMQVLGVDPAKKIAGSATKGGLETLPEFFTPTLAKSVREEYGPFALVTGNNVFAHADDLRGITEGVRELLREDGVFVFEVSYLVDVFEDTLFDTIYHEHVAYHSVKPLVSFFAEQGMELFAAERISSHGGSLRGMAQLKDGPHKSDGSVEKLVALENELGLDRAETLRQFGDKIDNVKRELKSLLKKIKDEGKVIAGFGAPAKATTLMYHFGIGPETIDFIIDDSPLKQGLYSPGHHIPVYSSKSIEDRKPDYLLILAWNFADPIIKKQAAFIESGGHFIVPLPKIEIR